MHVINNLYSNLLLNPDSNLLVNPHLNLLLQLTANLFLQLVNPLGVAGDQVSHVSDVHFVQQLGSNASFSQEGQFFRSQAVPSCRGVAAAVVTAVAGCTLGYLASRRRVSSFGHVGRGVVNSRLTVIFDGLWLYFRLRKGQKGAG